MSRALPMDPNHRIFSYFRDGSSPIDTPAQRRRRRHKLGHLAAIERRDGTVNLSTKHQAPDMAPPGVTP